METLGDHDHPAMSAYTYVLREVPEPARPAVAALLGKVFNLKDTTCASIAQSAPIVLLADLERDEAAVLQVVLSGLHRAGAVVELTEGHPDDLGKIDWPRRPQIFRRELADYVADFQFLPPGSPASLVTLCAGALPGGAPVTLAPQPSPPALPRHEDAPRPALTSIPLPEITPFGGMAALPPSPAQPPTKALSPRTPLPMPTAPATKGGDDTLSRLDELFPEDESSGFVPNNQDITSILNKLLPDEEAPGANASSSGHRSAVPSPAAGSSALGHAVFLAKIADEGRRQKAVVLIAELAKISTEDAEALSKKVIIPVLKGATKEEAESAKQKFAKIGILARVKGPDA